MNIDNFEDQVKEAFDRHRPDTDNDVLWENIEPHLKKKKKRRGIIFWLLGLGVSWLLLFGWFNDRKPGTAPLASTAVGKTAAAEPSGRAMQGQKQWTTVPEHKTFVRGATTPSGARNMVSAKHNALDTGERNRSVPTYPAPGPTALPDPAVHRQAAETDVFKGPAASPNPETGTPGGMFVEKQNAVELPLPPPLPETSAPEAAVQEKKSNPEVIPGPQEEHAAKPEETASAEIEPQDRKKARKRKGTWERNISLQAGPALAFRRLDERPWSGTAPAEYLKARQSTESSLESFAASLFYSVIARNGLVLKAGLDYRQSNEKFHLAFTNTETEQINGVLTVTVNAAGAVISQTTGPKTVTKTTEYSNTVYNHYRYINLPFGFGYRHLSEKSHWELSGGADLNLLFRVDGAIYNRYEEPTSLKFGGVFYDDVFRRHTGLGLWAAFAYGRNLTDKLRWQVSANVQAPLNPVSAPDYELEQRYINFGLQAGVVYQVK